MRRSRQGRFPTYPTMPHMVGKDYATYDREMSGTERTPGRTGPEAGAGPSGLGGRPSRRITVLGGVISVLALAGVIVWATGQEAPTFPSDAAEWVALAGAVGLYAAAIGLRGERWWRLLEDSSAHASRADAQALTVVGYMGNNVLPARGGDVLRVVLLVPRSTASARTIIGTLVAERVLDVAFLLGLFVFLAFVVLRGIDTPDAEVLVTAVLGAITVIAVVGLVIYLMRDRSIVQRALALLAPLAEPTRRLRGAHGASMLGQTTAIWLFEALTYLAVASSVNVEMNLVEAGYLIAVASVFVLIPSGPGYVGTLDAAVIFGLGAIGIEGSAALSYLLMLRFVLLVPVTITGLGLLVARYRGTDLSEARPPGI